MKDEKMIKKIDNSKMIWKILWELLNINYKTLILDILKIAFISSMFGFFGILSLASMDKLQNQDLINTFREAAKQFYWVIYFLYIFSYAISYLLGGRRNKLYKVYHPEFIFDKSEWKKMKKEKEKYPIVNFLLCLNKSKISKNIIAVIAIAFMYSFINVFWYGQEISFYMVEKEFFISCLVCFIIMLFYEMIYYSVGNRIRVEENVRKTVINYEKEYCEVLSQIRSDEQNLSETKVGLAGMFLVAYLIDFPFISATLSALSDSGQNIINIEKDLKVKEEKDTLLKDILFIYAFSAAISVVYHKIRINSFISFDSDMEYARKIIKKLIVIDIPYVHDNKVDYFDTDLYKRLCKEVCEKELHLFTQTETMLISNKELLLIIAEKLDVGTFNQNEINLLIEECKREVEIKRDKGND